MAKVLGLDISTSNIGMTVADEDDVIYEFISIPLNKIVKDKDLFKKVTVFEIAINKIIAKHDISHTFIEKPLEFFKQDESMAHTIILLNCFNILCQYILHQKKMKYTLVSSSTALKLAIGRGTKPSWIKDKKPWLAEIFEGMHPEIELARFSKGKDVGKIHSSMYDPIDAWVLTRCINAAINK
jgi:hypothetical protein